MHWVLLIVGIIAWAAWVDWAEKGNSKIARWSNRLQLWILFAWIGFWILITYIRFTNPFV